MAYAALVSVSQTLDQILDLGPHFFPCTKEKVESFRETIDSLIAFLDNCPPYCTQMVNNLITRIRDSAYEAEDVFESLVAAHLLRKYDNDIYDNYRISPPSLDKVMEEIESLVKEVENSEQDGNVVLEQRLLTLASSTSQLVSVLETFNQILIIDPSFIPFNEEKGKFFQETVDSLRVFCPPECTQTVDDLVTEVNHLAEKARGLFQSLVEKDLLLNYGNRHEKFKIFAQSLEKVMEDIESIEREVARIHQDGNGKHGQRILALASSSRPALRGYNKKVEALEDDLKMKLMERLVGGCSRIAVVPIVGMGGIGKTTLARILCDSQLIKETFDIRGWATISQTYNVQEIVLGILKDIRVPLDEKKDSEQHLYQTLYDRKYLIVLDDVWDTQAWDDIKKLFPVNNNGSRVILTTRHSKVAAYANSIDTYHEMQLLNEDSSWSLLCQEIFLQNNCPPELVEIGKQIARQCQGLPLAISAIGGHLKKETLTKEYWKHVSGNVSSVLKTSNDPSLEILTLSYNYLPHHLKACFLCFCIFQENGAIDVSQIVKLWIAEGFVKPSRLNTMEKTAGEYLNDVIDRNLAFVYEHDSFGKPKKCGVHDLFGDICIREAKKEKFLSMCSFGAFDLAEINSQRRLVAIPFIIKDDESPSGSIDSRYDNCSAIRSFTCLEWFEDSSSVLLASGLLKVLNVRIESFVFPLEILELVNLKYLQLDTISEIPSSISRLRNLQTLIALSVCRNLIPSEIWEMPQLRYLLIWAVWLPDIPDDQGKGKNIYVLKNLQTLSEIENFRCTQEVLTRIPNLKKLKIMYRNAVGLEFHSLNNLVYLCELESLRCRFPLVGNDNILPNLAFPFSLKKLVLAGCRIPWGQMTIIGILPNLEVLKLEYRAMKGKFWETTDDEFKQLKFLTIQRSDLVDWKTEKDHFPCLQRLILEHSKHLEAIPSEIGEIPTLETIELADCSRGAQSTANEILGEDSDIELKIVNFYGYSSSGSSDDLGSYADSLHDLGDLSSNADNFPFDNV